MERNARPYTPSAPPAELSVSAVWIELQRIQLALLALREVKLPVLHAEPEKASEGLLVIADGADWNPGGGQGVYYYFGGAWNGPL